MYIVNEWCKNKRAQSKATKPDNNPKYLMKRVDASKPLAFLGVPADGVHFLQELCNYTNYPASENVKCYHSADQR